MVTILRDEMVTIITSKPQPLAARLKPLGSFLPLYLKLVSAEGYEGRWSNNLPCRPSDRPKQGISWVL